MKKKANIQRLAIKKSDELSERIDASCGLYLPCPKPYAPEWVVLVCWAIRGGLPLKQEVWKEAEPHIRWLVRIDENNQAVWSDEWSDEYDDDEEE